MIAGIGPLPGTLDLGTVSLGWCGPERKLLAGCSKEGCRRTSGACKWSHTLQHILPLFDCTREGESCEYPYTVNKGVRIINDQHVLKIDKSAACVCEIDCAGGVAPISLVYRFPLRLWRIVQAH